MRWSRCPECGKPISFAPLQNGVRVAFDKEQAADGNWYPHASGTMRRYTSNVPGDVPRYERHACEGMT